MQFVTSPITYSRLWAFSLSVPYRLYSGKYRLFYEAHAEELWLELSELLTVFLSFSPLSENGKFGHCRCNLGEDSRTRKFSIINLSVSFYPTTFISVRLSPSINSVFLSLPHQPSPEGDLFCSLWYQRMRKELRKVQPRYQQLKTNPFLSCLSQESHTIRCIMHVRCHG